MGKRDDDEINRMKLGQLIERSRDIIAQYEDGFQHHRKSIEENLYALGKLDQKLEDAA